MIIESIGIHGVSLGLVVLVPVSVFLLIGAIGWRRKAAKLADEVDGLGGELEARGEEMNELEEKYEETVKWDRRQKDDVGRLELEIRRRGVVVPEGLAINEYVGEALKAMSELTATCTLLRTELHRAACIVPGELADEAIAEAVVAEVGKLRRALPAGTNLHECIDRALGTIDAQEKAIDEQRKELNARGVIIDAMHKREGELGKEIKGVWEDTGKAACEVAPGLIRLLRQTVAETAAGGCQWFVSVPEGEGYPGGAGCNRGVRTGEKLLKCRRVWLGCCDDYEQSEAADSAAKPVDVGACQACECQGFDERVADFLRRLGVKMGEDGKLTTEGPGWFGRLFSQRTSRAGPA